MRYLTLAADYLEPSVTDAATELLDLDALGLSAVLSEAVRAWNSRYQRIVPLPPAERLALADEIGRLDRAGLDLAGMIAAELAPAAVRYYSEGLSRELGQRERSPGAPSTPGAADRASASVLGGLGEAVDQEP